MNKGQWDRLPQEYKDIIDGLSGYEASMGAAQVFRCAMADGSYPKYPFKSAQPGS